MIERRSGLYWFISSVLVIVPALFFSSPPLLEQLLMKFFLFFPALKNWGIGDTVTDKVFFIISFLGIFIFLLTSVGRFQEYKIHIDAISFCRRQLNLFKYFSYISIGYVFSFFTLLYAELFFKNRDVIKFFSSISVLIFSTITFFLCFLIIKVFILEEILDHLKLDKDLETLIETIPGLSNLKKK